jgi:hypothetical protein
MSTNSEMTGMLAFLVGKPGSGKTGLTKFLIRARIKAAEKENEPVEGMMIFCADPQQWKGIFPDQLIITPDRYANMVKNGFDWWKNFYDKQQEFMAANNRYNRWIIIVDDALMFDMIRAGGNQVTSFEKILTVYRALHLDLIVTTQKVRGFTPSLRQYCSLIAIFPAGGDQEIRDIYGQFGSGIWNDVKVCKGAMEDLMRKPRYTFMMVNKRKQDETTGNYVVTIEKLTAKNVEANLKMQIQVENPDALIAVEPPKMLGNESDSD